MSIIVPTYGFRVHKPVLPQLPVWVWSSVSFNPLLVGRSPIQGKKTFNELKVNCPIVPGEALLTLQAYI